jgi:monofunctional biosynthetic peptidoglycan transglycosylase
MMRLRARQDPAAAKARQYRPVPLDSIARPVLQAATTGEDDRFWEHGGVDYLAILRALGYRRADFKWDSARDRVEFRRVLGRVWSKRDELRGASTITQQLAKNLYLSPSRNPLRKVKEAVTAYRLEWALGKRRILELYLNVAELGKETWGVEAASRGYFDRPAARLSRSQAAALAGSLPFPLRSNPGYRPGRMRWRQDLILRRMGGEAIEVPREVPEDEAPPPPTPEPIPDTLAPAPADSVPELRPVPVDTLLPPAPPLPDSAN